jgi:bacillolysin
MTRTPWKGVVLGCLLAGVLAFGFDLRTQGPAFDRDGGVPVPDGRNVFATPARGLSLWIKVTDSRIASGELRLALAQTEDDLGLRHERYDQYYRGLRVWGAQLIRHERQGEVYLINGTIREGIHIATTPTLTAADAEANARAALPPGDYRLSGEPELIVFPAESAFHLAYLVFLSQPLNDMFLFVDAQSGRVLFRYNNVQTTETGEVGLGTGTFGDTKKLSTTRRDDGKFITKDLLRPAVLSTATANQGTSYTTAWYLLDDDNTWTSDPTVVDGHAQLGYIYDYFYRVHNRKGMDDGNQDNVLVVHFGSAYQNAFFTSATEWLYFGDNAAGQYPYAAALDIVAHEYAHGVNYHTCNQIYWGESGALSEAFSDIMGVSCEFFIQAAGTGYGKAEWWEGEDTKNPFGPMRNLSDPYSQIWYPSLGLRYPDHWSRRFTPDFLGGYDNDGVHINMTIATHWYYLLAAGGTNGYSGLTVSGIGVGDAQRIAYRAWTYYLGPASTFAGARSATYQAAVDLFGGSSTQAQRVAQAWTAVGVN